jgi:hypothetical protein
MEILFGMPTEHASKLAKAGKLVIGGCCREIGEPDRVCPECHYQWDSESGQGKIVIPEAGED